MRYNNIETLRSIKNNAKHYATVYFPELPLSDNDTYILTDNTDTFTSIANNFWGDVNLWWIIPAINPNIRKDSFRCASGTQLRLPDLQEYIDEFIKVNN